LSVAMFDALGAKTKVMELGDVRAALQSGEVDGHDNTWSNILTQNLYQSQQMTETYHQALMYIVVTSRAFLDSLEPAVRDQFLSILKEVSAGTNRHALQMEADNRAALAAAGASIHSLTDAEREAWAAKMHPVWERYEQMIGSDLIETARRPPN